MDTKTKTVVMFDVVDKDGEKVFATQGIFLDCIDAHDFYEASISVKRSGKEVAHGGIRQVGTHGPVPMFSLFGVINCYDRPDPLLSSEFELGDRLEIAPDILDWRCDYKWHYACEEVWESFREENDRICLIADDDKYDEENNKLHEKTEKLIAEFVVADGTVWKRRK